MNRKIKNVIRKAQTIKKAFTEDLPIDEDWYKERIEACLKCPHNSDNVSEKDKGLAFKATELSRGAICSQKHWCTLCTCCLEEKCSQKSEYCAKQDKGEKPEWIALEAYSPIDENISVSLQDNNYSLKHTSEDIVIDMGITKENVERFDFIVSRPASYKYLSVKASCGCTVPTVEDISKTEQKVSVSLSTLGFTKNVVQTKSITFTFNECTFKVKLKIIKI